MPDVQLAQLEAGELRVVWWTAACVASLIALFAAKRHFGWQGWRSASRQGIRRAISWTIWAIATKVPWKPILIWGPWVAMVAGVSWYFWADWRGKRAWDEFSNEARSRGWALSFDGPRSPIPDEKNVLAHPAVAKLLAKPEDLVALQDIPGLAPDRVPNPAEGRAISLTQWLDPPQPGLSERAAAERLRDLAEAEWRKLALLPEALRRPEVRIKYDREEPLNVEVALPTELTDLVYLAVAHFRARIAVAARLGLNDQIAEDLAIVRRLPRLIPPDALFHYMVHLGTLACHGPPLWDVLHRRVLNDAHLATIDRELAATSLLPALSRALQGEGALVIGAIEFAKNHRSEAVAFVEAWGGLHAPGSVTSPRELWEFARSQWHEAEIWIAPAGVFDLGKVSVAEDYFASIERMEGGDVSSLREFASDEERQLAGRSTRSAPQGLKMFFNSYTVARAIFTKSLKVEADLVLQRAAIAAERFRLANDKYPKRWEDLVPKYLPAAPTDPASGEPMEISNTADGGLRFRGAGLDGMMETDDDPVWIVPADPPAN